MGHLSVDCALKLKLFRPGITVILSAEKEISWLSFGRVILPSNKAKAICVILSVVPGGKPPIIVQSEFVSVFSIKQSTGIESMRKRLLTLPSMVRLFESVRFVISNSI